MFWSGHLGAKTLSQMKCADLLLFRVRVAVFKHNQLTLPINNFCIKICVLVSK